MTTMGLEIGGAETHIVELSRELTRRGHTVVVASAGGVYEDELKRCGVEHAYAPLNRKDPLSLVKSYQKLKRLIRREHFDIVHAHARIPAAICGALARRMGFKFITTAHYDFKVTPFYKRFADWGEYQLAVSHDLKNYLIESYGVPSDNITVTINGIDTEKFSSERDCSHIISELSLTPDAKRVLYVGRIDKEVAHAALRLAESAHKIAKRHPGVEVVIVGGGSAFEELTALAERSNELAGYRCVILAGPRTDIADFTASCDVFVGVSRAALEAMAAKRPCVLAGAQGYLGIFEESKLKRAQANNFTCRGEVIPDGDMISDDVCTLLAKNKDELCKMGEYNNEVVRRYYSVAKMTDDYLAVYSNAGTPLNKKAEVIISGYYGFKNLGDDALLCSLISSLRSVKPDIRLTVLSSKPKGMRSLYRARTVNRYNIFAVIREMRSAKLLINGGGNLIQDGTSRKSLLYYSFIMRLAKLMRLKLVLYANGIGPLYDKNSKKIAAKVIASADLITLRDADSLSLIRELGCNDAADRARISADPAFKPGCIDRKWIELLLSREGIKPDKRYFMVSVRSGNTLDEQNHDERVVHKLSAAVQAICKKYSMTPLFVPFQSEVDDSITERIKCVCGTGHILYGLSTDELCGILERCELAISMRLHLLIFAASCAVPMIGISYDKKVDSFMHHIGSDALADVRYFKSEDILRMADDIFEHANDKKDALKVRSHELMTLAAKDANDVIALLENTK